MQDRWGRLWEMRLEVHRDNPTRTGEGQGNFAACTIMDFAELKELGPSCTGFESFPSIGSKSSTPMHYTGVSKCQVRNGDMFNFCRYVMKEMA
ncbi:hypothetical protein PIB30_061038 [Stylosanthes scabra]|uniref:Uncharacterized protein n=1 Tax=Stylosanthes scabra TaxID=79078 RepID=A0ABU6RKN0_9FABA|nr:hypothetical protein [Stylosanthes scabra]